MESTKELVDRYLANDEDLVVGTYLAHYGTPRHSGRYPWGSGKEPYQSLGSSARAGEKFIKSFSKKSRVEKQNEKRKAKAEESAAKKKKADSKKTKYRNEKEYVKTLSDEELRRINNRDQMEATYLKNHPQKQPLPKALADKAMKDIIVPAVTEVVKEQGKAYVKGKLNSAAQKIVNQSKQKKNNR